jgi:Cys-tRNA(Pro)/Cys-tRNA(Cys) deacylase
MSDTNAVKWLRTQGVAFTVLEYAFTQIGAEHAAAAVDRPLEMVCKTLIVKASGNAYYLAIVPGDQRFDPRRMAAAIGAAHADIAPPAEAEKTTGYKVGGISPFAQRRKLPCLIEESLLALEMIIVNGGRRGVLIEMNTETLVALLDARPANICRV